MQFDKYLFCFKVRKWGQGRIPQMVYFVSGMSQPYDPQPCISGALSPLLRNSRDKGKERRKLRLTMDKADT